MNIYCTLFDSNYLDKGLVLYRSLCRCEESFRLYVFAFDNKCAKILRQENLHSLVIVPLEEFETPELLKIKGERTRAEYCWTCTPFTIQHVLDKYNEPICTYIDADLMFYSSGSNVIQKMYDSGCSSVIVPHRLPDTPKGRAQEEHAGKYCVQFNTFVNNADGRAALDWWAAACLEWCFYVPPKTGETRFGDQKYLEEFPKRFPGVYICEDAGVGMAHWNAGQLKMGRQPGEVIYKNTGKAYPAVFFHFASILHLSKHWVNANSGITDKTLHKLLCDDYIEQIRKERKLLREKYGLELYVRRRVTQNPIMAFYQSFISPIIHVKRLSDIYKI